ncbi:MAG: glycosyltransferase [Bryobacteraceae bacterium]
MKERIKRLLFALLGKDPEAVVITLGDARLAERVKQLIPGRRHFLVSPEAGAGRLRREFRRYRIGMVAVGESKRARMAALLFAPRKVLVFNARLEHHHLRFTHWLAGLLFLRGVPVDRIYLRPRWLCPWKRDRTATPAGIRIVEGRPPAAGRRRVAVLSPYFPYPLSHGGAVRIYNLLREAAREFDVYLFAFTDGPVDPGPLAGFCSGIVLAEKPRYREPRWSTLLPPEVHEFRSPAMRAALERGLREWRIEALQVEYTQLAPYGGDALVEHDVTFDLFGQVWRRDRTLASWWDWFRWRRFERRAVRHFRNVVVMSAKDREMLGRGEVIENGVDLARFQPVPEPPGRRLLFIGSFRHFPNVQAFRFFREEVWPLLRVPEMTATVVCGPDALTYWQAFTNQLALPEDPRMRLLGFVADVRPLYEEANLVIVPTTVSAGTNVKVLEAMAMERAVVSTPSGCAGLGLEHAKSVWVAETAREFAAGIARLIEDPPARAAIARAARRLAEERFDWQALGEKQRALLRRITEPGRAAPR